MNQPYYTDSPPLHTSLLFGSVQLLFWLLFHPSAWKNEIKCLSQTDDHNLSLLKPSRAQWQNGELRRILLRVHLFLPLVPSFAVAMVNILLGVRFPTPFNRLIISVL